MQTEEEHNAGVWVVCAAAGPFAAGAPGVLAFGGDHPAAVVYSVFALAQGATLALPSGDARAVVAARRELCSTRANHV